MSEDRSRQVYIGYLPNDARMEDVEDFFKGMKLFFPRNLSFFAHHWIN